MSKQTLDLSKFTVGAEIEFYLLDSGNKPIADLLSGKFPIKAFEVKPEFDVSLADFKMDIEKNWSFQAESGAGQFEVNFIPQKTATALAEDISNFKMRALELAKKHGFMLSFAAKPLPDQPGSALHIHYCNELFDPYGLQANGGAMPVQVQANNNFVRFAIGGMLAKMPEATALFCDNAPDMTRFEPWFNAPTKICWGANNRSTAIRIPDAKPKRIEHRVACANVAPLPLIEHVVAAAEFGMREQIEPSAQVFGNAWEDKYNFPLIFGAN